MTAGRGDSRRLSAVPTPGTSAVPKPKPPPGNPYVRNPLLAYKIGPDPEGQCTACRWVKAQAGFEYCPYHVAWRDMRVHKVDRVGDAKGAFTAHATTEPEYKRGDRVWFQGKLQVKIDQRYWGADGHWRYIAKVISGGAAVDSPQHMFTPEFDAGWKA